MDKKQVQEALGRINQALAQLNTNRQGHLTLVNDVRLIQTVCTERFAEGEAKPKVEPKKPEKKDGGTDEQFKRLESDYENSEGSGDSI